MVFGPSVFIKMNSVPPGHQIIYGLSGVAVGVSFSLIDLLLACDGVGINMVATRQHLASQPEAEQLLAKCCCVATTLTPTPPHEEKKIFFCFQPLSQLSPLPLFSLSINLATFFKNFIEGFASPWIVMLKG